MPELIYNGTTFVIDRGSHALDLLMHVAADLNGLLSDAEKMAFDIDVNKRRIDAQAQRLACVGQGGGDNGAALALAVGLRPAPVVPPVVTPQLPTTPSVQRNTGTPPILSNVHASAAGLAFVPGVGSPTDRTFRVVWTQNANLGGGNVIASVLFGTPYAFPPIVTLTDETLNATTATAFNVTATGFDIATRAGLGTTLSYRLGVVVVPTSESFD